MDLSEDVGLSRDHRKIDWSHLQNRQDHARFILQKNICADNRGINLAIGGCFKDCLVYNLPSNIRKLRTSHARKLSVSLMLPEP